MRFLTWAKQLHIWQLCLVLTPLLLPLAIQNSLDNTRRSFLTWSIPERSELMQVSGELMPAYAAYRDKLVYTWGRLRLEDGSVFSFTCKPILTGPVLGDPACAYSTPYDQDPNIGKKVFLKYFDVPSQGSSPHVVMEITEAKPSVRHDLLIYADSLNRLNDYKRDAKRPGFGTVVFLVIIALSLPGVIFRLATGRGPDHRVGANTASGSTT
jgi:hypothetical protein